MENRTINIGVVAEVAKALCELKEQMVFIGGSVISLYANDPAADEIRPTADIDLTIRLINFNDWNQLQERLGKLGFFPDPFGHAICSYKYKDIPVDIMASKNGPHGPSNRWYEIGFDHLIKIKAKDEEIRVFSAPCYLATKFEAYNDRGRDYRTSHDFEDIIYVLDNRTTIVDEIKMAPKQVMDFLKSEIQKITTSPYFDEITEAHLHPLMVEERQPLLKEKLNQIAAL